jgi:hypothetical protein
LKRECRTMQEPAHSFRGKSGEFDLAPFMVKFGSRQRLRRHLAGCVDASKIGNATTPPVIAPTALSIPQRLRCKGLASRALPLANPQFGEAGFLQIADDQASRPNKEGMPSLARLMNSHTAAQPSLGCLPFLETRELTRSVGPRPRGRWLATATTIGFRPWW